MAEISAIDFRKVIENNEERIRRLYDQSRAWSVRPSDLFYPNMQCPVAKYTFDDMVYEHCHVEWCETQHLIYGMGAIGGT